MELMRSAIPNEIMSVNGSAIPSRIRVFLHAIWKVRSFRTHLNESSPKPCPVLVIYTYLR